MRLALKRCARRERDQYGWSRGVGNAALAQDGVGKNSITIGQSIVLAGLGASIARPYYEGAKLYFDRVNAAGGVAGRKIDVVTLDDNGRSVTTVANTRKLLEQGVFYDGQSLVRAWQGERAVVARRSDFTPMGVHNLENALAAVAAAIPFRVPPDTIRAALRTYRALPHRMELVRVVDGVAYINDSKATNVDATIKSLMSVEGPVAVILGGLSCRSASIRTSTPEKSKPSIGAARSTPLIMQAARAESSSSTGLSASSRPSSDVSRSTCACRTPLMLPRASMRRAAMA